MAGFMVSLQAATATATSAAATTRPRASGGGLGRQRRPRGPPLQTARGREGAVAGSNAVVAAATAAPRDGASGEVADHASPIITRPISPAARVAGICRHPRARAATPPHRRRRRAGSTAACHNDLRCCRRRRPRDALEPWLRGGRRALCGPSLPPPPSGVSLLRPVPPGPRPPRSAPPRQRPRPQRVSWVLSPKSFVALGPAQGACGRSTSPARS